MSIFDKKRFTLIAGPCVIEGREITRSIAQELKEIASKYDIDLIFKASYRKANRSRYDSFTGIGNEAGLEILQSVKEDFGLRITTDIHLPEEAQLAASYKVDILQIPAFLCRQTDILEAAADTGLAVNIKKGQFLSPAAMKFAAEKVTHRGNTQVAITERGTQFGYTDLIVDFTGVPIMKQFGFPVVLDVTHSLQMPNQQTGVTGGRPEMIATLAKAGIAVGADALFMEVHPNPQNALSDGANMLKLANLQKLLEELLPIWKVVSNQKG